MNKFEKAFEQELSYITDNTFKGYIVKFLDTCPDWILSSPSSSTGKYHPADEINEMGMIIHVKRCVAMALEYSRLKDMTHRQTDVLIAGCMLHDVYKAGKTERINFTSPVHALDVYNALTEFTLNNIGMNIYNDMFKVLAWLCLNHEGVWNIIQSKDIQRPNVVFNWGNLEEGIHLIDYMVSRRSIWESMQTIMTAEEYNKIHAD